MKIELTDAEADLLTEMLKMKKGELPIAIHHCTNREFKTLLKHREKMVEDILIRMGIN